jgi:hypothetical protein
MAAAAGDRVDGKAYRTDELEGNMRTEKEAASVVGLKGSR